MAELLDPAIPKPFLPQKQFLNQRILCVQGVFRWVSVTGLLILKYCHPLFSPLPDTLPRGIPGCLLCGTYTASERPGGSIWIRHLAQATGWKVHGLHVEGVAMWVVLLAQVELAEA